MRETSKSVTAAAALAVLLGGCASVDVVRVRDDNNPSGFRVFAPRPYVVVAGSTVSTVVLPDCSREYAVRPFSLFAKNDFTLKLTNGMITEATSNQDSTLVPNTLVSVLGGALTSKPAGKATASTEEATQGQATLGIFAVECSGQNLIVTSAQPGDPAVSFEVTDTAKTAVVRTGSGPDAATPGARADTSSSSTSTVTTTSRGSLASPFGQLIQVPMAHDATPAHASPPADEAEPSTPPKEPKTPGAETPAQPGGDVTPPTGGHRGGQ